MQTFQSLLKEKFDSSNYESERPLPKRKNKIVIKIMKDEIDGDIMTEFAALRPKTYSYLTDTSDEKQKANGTKMCALKRKIKLKIIKNVWKQLKSRKTKPTGKKKR